MWKQRVSLVAVAALAACDARPTPEQSAPTASATAPAGVTGIFCAVTQGTACYDLDVPNGRVTLMMGEQRGRSFPLVKQDESAYSFALAPNQQMWLRLRDPDTLEVSSARDTQSFIVLRRKR